MAVDSVCKKSITQFEKENKKFLVLVYSKSGK